MAKGVDLLNITMPCGASSGIVPRRGLIFDASNRGNVKLPSNVAISPFAGVSLESASSANNVAVQVAGVATIESDGSAVIEPGDAVILVVNTGRCKAQALNATNAATYYNVIGHCVASAEVPNTAGALVPVLLSPYNVLAA